MNLSIVADTLTIATHKPRNPLPWFGLSMGYTLTYGALLIFIPIGMLVLHAAQMPFATLIEAITDPRALAAYRLSFGGALLAGLTNCVLGTVTAWVITRYQFPGKGILDALVDLPFAVPTAVAGIALTAVWSSTGFPGSVFDGSSSGCCVSESR